MKPRRSLLWLFAGLVCIARADDLNVSGTYYDKGTRIGSAGEDPAMVSLHGLLSLEFRPHIHAADYLDAARVTMMEADGRIAFEIRDDAGREIWGDMWSANEGYSSSAEGAVVRIQANASDSQRAVLIMRQIDNGNVLKVRAYEVGSTLFGPNANPIDTYVFIRAD